MSKTQIIVEGAIQQCKDEAAIQVSVLLRRIQSHVYNYTMKFQDFLTVTKTSKVLIYPHMPNQTSFYLLVINVSLQPLLKSW